MSNFPLRLIAEPDADEREMMGERRTRRGDNLGLLIDDQAPVAGQPAGEDGDGLLGELRTVERISRIVGAMMKTADEEMLMRYNMHVCRIPAAGYGTLEFDLAGRRLEDLLAGGREAMRRHLETRRLT